MIADNAEIRQVGLAEAIRHSLWIIVALGLLGFGFGLLAGQQIDTKFTATTPILLNPLDGNPFYPSSRGEQLINLATESQALRSNAVATMVEKKTGKVGPETDLLSKVKVSVPVNTQILEVSFISGSRGESLKYSQAFADAYLEFRRQRAQDRLGEQSAQLAEQTKAINTELDALASERSTLPKESVRAGVIDQRMTSLSNQLNSLSSRSTELSAVPLDPGQVVTPAAVDAAGLDLKLLLPLAGLVFGVLGGLGIAILRLKADTRIHQPSELRRLGVSVIGSLGWTDPTATADLEMTEGAIDDEYRKIRVAVLSLERRRPFSLLVAQASSDSAGPLSAVDLGTSFARSGMDTLIIDATSQGKGPATVLSPDSALGLSDVLNGNRSLSEALDTVAPLLSSLAPGDGIAQATDLFVGDDMSHLLIWAKSHFDVIIIATESIQNGDAQSLASVVEAVVVEATEDETTRSEMERATQALELLPSTLLGAIFVGKKAVRRGQSFSLHTTVNRRQLPSGPLGALHGSVSLGEPPDPSGDYPATDESAVDPEISYEPLKTDSAPNESNGGGRTNGEVSRRDAPGKPSTPPTRDSGRKASGTKAVPLRPPPRTRPPSEAGGPKPVDR